MAEARRGYSDGRSLEVVADMPTQAADRNPLEAWFDTHRTGPGVWKWRHYFEIYHRHLAKFVSKGPTVLEVGIYSGGSLLMWRDYFGPGTVIYGVDIEPACKSYEADAVHVLMGDQADSGFWRRVLAEIPPLDVVLDDGGHLPEQQIVTLEALLPRLRPGGVYLCEDIADPKNAFLDYVDGLSRHLHHSEDGASRKQPTAFQQLVSSVHVYPYAVVIERRERVLELSAERHGTEWQPFSG